MNEIIKILDGNEGIWGFIALVLTFIGWRIGSRISNSKSETTHTNSPHFQAGRDINFGKEVVNNGNKEQRKRKSVKINNNNLLIKEWKVGVDGADWKILNIPARIDRLKTVSACVQIITPGQIRWRAGLVFENDDSKRDYVFHVYQDAGGSEFRSRIVERIPGVRDIDEKLKDNIGIRDPRNFKLTISNKNNMLSFYADGIYLGRYYVPMRSITNLNVASWSDEKPITVIFKDIKVL